MARHSNPLLRRALLGMAVIAVVLAPNEVIAGIERKPEPTYRSASVLEPAPVATAYLPAPRAVESERIDLAELRARLTETSEDEYVDLGRFHLLERD